MHLRLIRQQMDAFIEAKRYLASNYTTVAGRKTAIDDAHAFASAAPAFIEELVSELEDLIAATDGEKCSDPGSCNRPVGPLWMCMRCRVRRLAEEGR